DRDVRAVRAHLQEQLVGVVGLPDDLEARLLEQPRNPFAEEHGVVGEDDPHSGISATTRVPPADGLSTRKEPSRTATRSASPRRPEPFRRLAPPTPSSVTSTRSRPSGADT